MNLPCACTFKRECDPCLRRRVSFLLPRGTFGHLEEVIDFERPAYVTVDDVKREIAVRWLHRPSKWWRRIVWALRLAFGSAR